MHREEIERQLEALNRRDLMRLASELKIAGRSRMKKRSLIEGILLARMCDLLLESPEGVRDLRRKDLISVCQRMGIKIRLQSTKRELAQALLLALMRKSPPELPEERRSSDDGQKIVKRSGFRVAEPLCDSSSAYGDLPGSYNKTTVVLLPVDPYLVHAYWEVAAGGLEEAESLLGNDRVRARPVLRFYDVTGILVEGTSPHAVFDIDVDLKARNWYVHLSSSGRAYRVELGYATVQGRFLAMAQSNVAHTPPARPSNKEEELYMRVAKDAQNAELLIPPVGKQTSRHGLLQHGQRREHAGLLPVTGDERPLGQPLPWTEKTQGEAGRHKTGETSDAHIGHKTLTVEPLEMGHPDLNEMSEQRFVCGLSSGLTHAGTAKLKIQSQGKNTGAQ